MLLRSAAMTSHNADPPPIDLPPRTWRGWWHSWPKWFRIGCWAFFGLIVLHLALVVRIYVGLQEPTEITDLRTRSSIRYSWEDQPRLFWQHHTLLAGLMGKSWRNIVEIKSYRLTAADLQRIGARCRSLKVLSLHGDNYPVHGTDVDDDMIRNLIGLKSLKHLGLEGTLVSDQSLAVFEQLPSLESVDAAWTDITMAAVDDCLRRSKFRFSVHGARVDSSLQSDVLGSIRWSDGTRSSGIPSGHNFLIAFTRPRRGTVRRTSASGLRRRDLFWNGWSDGDGEYRMTLRVGDYDAEPVIIMVTDDKPSVPTIEFHMPCTRSEALRVVETERE